MNILVLLWKLSLSIVRYVILSTSILLGLVEVLIPIPLSVRRDLLVIIHECTLGSIDSLLFLGGFETSNHGEDIHYFLITQYVINSH